MNRALIRSGSLIISVIFPFSAIAQTQVTTPVMFVRPIDMSKQQEQIRTDEHALGGLVEEAKKLIEEVEQKKRMAKGLMQVVSDNKELDQLKETLKSYQVQIEQRNRMLAVRDQILSEREAQIATLNLNLKKLTLAPKEAQQLSDRVTVLEQKFQQLKMNLDDAKGQLHTALLKLDSAQNVSKLQTEIREKTEELSLVKRDLDKIREAEIVATRQKHETIRPPSDFDQQDTSAVHKLLNEKIYQLGLLKDEMRKVKDQLAQANERYRTMPSDKTQGADRELVEKLNVQNTRLAELEKSLKAKDEQLAKFDHGVEDKDKEIVLLKQLVAQFKEENAGLKAELAKDDNAFAVIYKNGMILKQKLKDKDSALAAQEKTISEYKSQLTAQQNMPDVSTAKTAELEQQIKSKDDALQEKDNALKEKEAALVAKEQAVEEYKAQLSNQQTAPDVSIARTTELEEQIKSKDNVLKEKEDALKEKDSSLQQKDNSLMEKEAALAAKEQAIAEYKVQLNAWQNAAESTTTQAAELQQQLQAKDNDLQIMNKRLHLWEKLAKAHRQRIALLVDKNLSYQFKLSQTIRSWKKQNNHFDQKIMDLHRAINKAEIQIEILNQLIEHMRLQKQNLGQMMGRTEQSSSAEYQARLDQLDQDLQSAKSQAAAKQRELEFMKVELNKAKQFAQAAHKQTGVKDLSLSMVQAMMEQKDKANEALTAQLQEQIKSSGEELALVREELAVAEAKLRQAVQDDELAHVQEMLKSSREEIVQLHALLTQKEDQIAQLQEDLDVNSKNFGGQNQALEDLKVELAKQHVLITKLKDDLHWKDKEIARLMLRAKEEISAIVERLRIVEKKLQQATGQKNDTDIEKALTEAKEQVETLKQNLRDKEVALRNAEAVSHDKDGQMQMMATEARQMKTIIDELTSKITILQTTPKKDFAGRANIAAMREELASRKEQIRTLENKLTATESGMEVLKAAREDNNANYEAMTKQVDEQKSKIKELLAKIVALQRMRKPQDEQTGADIKALRGEMKERDRRVKTLELDLSHAVNMLDAKDQDVAKLRKDLNDLQERLKSLSGSAQEIVKEKPEVQGNEGYLTRQTKELSTAIVEVTAQVDSMVDKAKASGAKNDDYRFKFEAVSKELQETKELLKACQDSMPASPKFSMPLKKASSVYASEDLIPEK